jgi:regulator of RNase E activity RraA
MTIHPGDLILGDADGVICVPQAEATAIYQAARKKFDDENSQRGSVEAGQFDRRWVDAALKRAAL